MYQIIINKTVYCILIVPVVENALKRNFNLFRRETQKFLVLTSSGTLFWKKFSKRKIRISKKLKIKSILFTFLSFYELLRNFSIYLLNFVFVVILKITTGINPRNREI